MEFLSPCLLGYKLATMDSSLERELRLQELGCNMVCLESSLLSDYQLSILEKWLNCHQLGLDLEYQHLVIVHIGFKECKMANNFA